MDFVAREIFYLFWFSLLMSGTFATNNIMPPYPDNQAVLSGTKSVSITCNCATSSANIKWFFTRVGSEVENPIILMNSKTYSVHPGNDGTSSTLVINEANNSTAGKYTCQDEGMYSVLLIVLKQTCDYSPRPSNTHPCGSTLQLSCVVTYFVTQKYFDSTQIWSSEPVTEDLVSPTPFSSIHEKILTKNSTLDVTLSEDVSQMPVYTCHITVNLIETALDGKTSKLGLPFSNTCQPFASASSVPCGETGPVTDDPKQAKEGSPRSAETNNLAIRVLGVAGVLLLAQMF